MKAVVCYGDNKVEFKEEAKPVIENGDDVIIKVKGTGICGSDQMLFKGNKDVFFINYPVIPGHEFTGIVEETGTDVEDVKIGDHVIVDNYLRCGKCSYCISGDYFQCDSHTELGFTSNGGFAEYCVVPENNLIKIPDDLDFKYAAIIENIATAIRACRKGNSKVGDNVVVIGAGPLGVLIAIISRYLGRNVTVVGRGMARLNRIKEMGFHKVLSSNDNNWVEEILSDTSGKGANTVFEVSGSNSTIPDAVKIVKKKGSLVFLGVTGGKTGQIDLDKIVLEEIRISGSISGQGAFNEAIKLSGKISEDLDKFITHTFPLKDIFTAVKYEQERIEGALKVVILQ